MGTVVPSGSPWALQLKRLKKYIEEETGGRALGLLRQLLREIPRIILITKGGAVDARPELFDYLLEVRDDGVPVGPVLRPVPFGPGWLTLKTELSSGSRRSAG